MTVNPLIPVSVSTVADNSTVCSGSTVTFTATPTNGGTTPAYQWYKNSQAISQATNATYSYIPANNDTITVVLTSNVNCAMGNTATSNTAVMIVNSPVAAAGTIAGSAIYSQGTTAVPYSIGVIANATNYIWTYTGTGVTINGSGNNVTLDFAANATDGQLMVQGSNTCGVGTASVLQLSGNKTLNLTSVLPEGLYNGSGTLRQAMNASGPNWPAGIADHITIELHSALSYATLIYSAPDIELSTSGTATITIPAAYNGSYYITIKHRNSIETTTATAISFASSTINQSYGTRANVYGNNLGLSLDGYYLIFGGDVNQDGSVNSADYTPVINDNAIFSKGYLSSDVDGNGSVNSADYTIIINNNSFFVKTLHP